MPNEWSFRNEILFATQRWPWLVLICIAGSLLGWMTAWIWPTPHRATRELYVGLNVYRALNDQSVSEYAGIQLVNANDYKNWQMSSLNNLIYMDSVINETLERLREQDPYWNSVRMEDFAKSLHVYWRNAGKWRLVAEHKDPERAAAAVTAWQQVVVDVVHSAVIESQEAMLLEFQLRAVADQKANAALTADEIRMVKNAFENWLQEFAGRMDGSNVGSAEHWQIWQEAAKIQSSIIAGDFLEFFPAEGSPRQEYLKWLNHALQLLERELDSLERLSKDLADKERTAAIQFSQASKNSLGLSATLDVDKISETRTLQLVTRPTGNLMLAGSLLGLFTWLAIWMGRISLRGKV